jgi:TolA-binding protein
MKRHWTAALCLFTCAAPLLGCSNQKATALEERSAREQAQIAALQQENEFLRNSLGEARVENQALQAELQKKEEVIKQFSQALEELQKREQPEPTPSEPEATPQKRTTLSDDYAADYEKALELFKKREYNQAADLFSSLLASDRSHSLADNCQYWLGECYYGMKKYEIALAEFQKVAAFSKANKADDAQFKIALCFLQLKKYPAAREELNRLIANYPESEYVTRARAELEKIPE